MGDNFNYDADNVGTRLIPRGLRAAGARGQSAGHVPFDPHALSESNLAVSHFKSNFPSSAQEQWTKLPASGEHQHGRQPTTEQTTNISAWVETGVANRSPLIAYMPTSSDKDSDIRDGRHGSDTTSQFSSPRDNSSAASAVNNSESQEYRTTPRVTEVTTSSPACGQDDQGHTGHVRARQTAALTRKVKHQHSCYVTKHEDDHQVDDKTNEIVDNVFNELDWRGVECADVRTATIHRKGRTERNLVTGGGTIARHLQDPITNTPGHLQDPVTNIPGHLQDPTTNIPVHPQDPTTNIPVHLQDPVTNIPGHLQDPIINIPGHLQDPTTNIPGHLQDPVTNIPVHLQDHFTNSPGHPLDSITNIPDHPQNASCNIAQSHLFPSTHTSYVYVSVRNAGSESNFRSHNLLGSLPPIAERVERESNSSIFKMPVERPAPPFSFGRLRLCSSPVLSSFGLSSASEREPSLSPRLVEVKYKRAISIEGSSSLISRPSPRPLATPARASENGLPQKETGSHGYSLPTSVLMTESIGSNQCVSSHGNSSSEYEQQERHGVHHQMFDESSRNSGENHRDKDNFDGEVRQEVRSGSTCPISPFLARSSVFACSSEALRASEGRLQSIIRRSKFSGSVPHDLKTGSDFTSAGTIDKTNQRTKRAFEGFSRNQETKCEERINTGWRKSDDTAVGDAAGEGARVSINDTDGDFEKDSGCKVQLDRKLLPSLAPGVGGIKSPARRHSIAVCLEFPDRTRRNSITLLPKMVTRVSSSSTLFASPSDRVGALPRRRSSSKETLARMLEAGRTAGESSCDIVSNLETLTWTYLMSTVSGSKLRETSVTNAELTVTLPVCNVTNNGSTFSVTSVEVLKQTLLKVYPNLQMLMQEPSTKEDEPLKNRALQHPGLSSSTPSLSVTSDSHAVNGKPVEGRRSCGCMPPSPTDVADEIPYFAKGRRMIQDRRKNGFVLPVTLDDKRRVSINSCIRTMRENSSNYDNQLLGCQNVGHYANEETVKVVLAKSDAISCVINALRLFPEKEELQRQACSSLLKMASVSEANCMHICQNDGVSALASTMRRYDNNLDIMRLMLNLLGYLSTTGGITWELVSQGCHCDVLAVMSRHAHDRFIVSQCCFVLGNLVISVETAQQLMLVGGVHTIISMMNRFYDDCEILENGCRALGSFAFYDDTCLDVAQAGATETVLAAITSDESNISVKECGCWALACLTSTTKTCEEFVSLDGLHGLLRTLEACPQEEQLLEYGVSILCNIGALDSTVPCVSTTRVVAVLTSVCRTFPENVELLEKVMVVFGQIANTEQVYRSLLSDGGLKSIISVMTSLPENQCIQDNGCRIIGNMAVTEHLRKSTEQQGASQAVIAAILNMDSCADILLCSCMALMNLTADITDNKMRAKTNGAVPTLLSTLRNFPDHPDIAVAVLKTIGNLVDLEEVCRQLIDERGLETIVDIGIGGQPPEDIRAFASRILSGFTSLPDLTEEQRKQIERTLVLMQSCSPDNPDIALSMCQGLHNLLKSGTLVTNGWLDVILSTVNHFRCEPEIHLTACRIIATLAFEAQGRLKEVASLVGQLAVTSVLQTLRTFPGEPELQLVGCGTLSCIAEHLGDLRHVVVSCGGVDDVIAAMIRFPADDRLHAVALIALADLLPLDMTDGPQDGKSVANAIFKSMSSFLENEEIQVSACRALKKCRASDSRDPLELLMYVRNAIRRHNDSDKVLTAAAKVFRRFGAGDPRSLAMKLLPPPTPIGSTFWETLDE